MPNETAPAQYPEPRVQQMCRATLRDVIRHDPARRHDAQAELDRRGD